MVRPLPKELGGRPTEQSFYRDGVADYEKMAKATDFGKGLARIVEGAKKHRIAIMCSEQDPLDCHRCLLVARALAERMATRGYSAKAARCGKDIGKPGKNFSKIASKAGKKYGSKAAGKRVAGAILASSGRRENRFVSGARLNDALL